MYTLNDRNTFTYKIDCMNLAIRKFRNQFNLYKIKSVL